MKLNIRIKYTITILSLILFITSLLIGIHLLYLRRAMERVIYTNSQIMKDSLLYQLEKRAGIFVQFLSEDLINPVYQYDMEAIYEITKATNGQEGVEYVYVYDKIGRIIHDGTEQFELLDKILEDEVSKKAVVAKRLIIQTTEDYVDAAAPIMIENELLGGIRVGFSLKGITKDIEETMDILRDIQKREIQQDIASTAMIGIALCLAGVVVAYIIAKRLSSPIRFLSALTVRMGRGEFDVDIPFKRTDEIGELAVSFKKMAKDLQTTTASRDELNKEIVERKKAEEELENTLQELKAAQAQLIQAEKLVSIGQMATGVAHEINNPLYVISGEAEMLLNDKGKDKDTKDASRIIIEQSKRIKAITENLLEFSRRKGPKFEPLDINKVVENSISLLSYQAKMNGIKIVKELESKLPKVSGDDDQLKEVFINIMLNAIQAMEENGTLTVKTYIENVTRYGRRKIDVFKCGQDVIVIEFKDTGCGMDEDTLKKIFDPFFTTKEKNTGLGLSICYGIIQNHNGLIQTQSRLGEGSAFIVKLPLLEKGGK